MSAALEFRNLTLGYDRHPAVHHLHGSGAVGDAALATAEKGEAVLEHGARAFLKLLDDVARFDLAQLAPGPLG